MAQSRVTGRSSPHPELTSRTSVCFLQHPHAALSRRGNVLAAATGILLDAETAERASFSKALPSCTAHGALRHLGLAGGSIDQRHGQTVRVLSEKINRSWGDMGGRLKHTRFLFLSFHMNEDPIFRITCALSFIQSTHRIFLIFLTSKKILLLFEQVARERRVAFLN